MYDSEYKSNARYIDMKKTVLCLEPLPMNQEGNGNLLIEKMLIGGIKPDTTTVMRWTIVDTKKVIAETLRTGLNI